MNWKKWLPTNKWWTATVTAAATVVGMAVTGDGINTDDEELLVIGLVAQRLIAWITPNEGRSK
jgi:hypothetical protein